MFYVNIQWRSNPIQKEQPHVWPAPAMDKQILAGPLAFISVPPELWLRAGRVLEVQPTCCEQQHCLEPPAFPAARSCLRGDTHGHVPWHRPHGRKLLASRLDWAILLAFSSWCLSAQLHVPAAASWTVPVLKDLFYISWRRKWQLTPVLLPGKSHGWRSLADYSPWGRKESDMTERLHSLLSSLRVTPWLFSCRGMVALLPESC